MNLTSSGRPGPEAMPTWQLPRGDDVGVQLVGVLQPHQGFGGSGLVVIVGEVLPLDGEVGDEHWHTQTDTQTNRKMT